MREPSDTSEQPRDPVADRAALPSLIKTLNHQNGIHRQEARQELVAIGPLAVPALIDALGSKTEHVRWEAAKALTEIPDGRAAQALVNVLEDRSFGVRWLAANALINIGADAFLPIVQALLERPDSPRLRDGAKHVLTALKKAGSSNPHLAPLLEALEGPARTETIPWVARDILKKLGLIPAS